MLKAAPTLLTNQGNQKSPSYDWNLLPVTPADGTDLPGGPTAGLVVTTAGNFNVNLFGGGTAVLTGLALGQQLPICVTRVLSTSTTGACAAAYN